MGACKVTNNTAIKSSAETSAMAQCTTLRKNTTSSDAITSKVANR